MHDAAYMQVESELLIEWDNMLINRACFDEWDNKLIEHVFIEWDNILIEHVFVEWDNILIMYLGVIRCHQPFISMSSVCHQM